MKTKEQVEKLKKEWEKNPNWYIEKELGYEEYEAELKKYWIEKEKEWTQERVQKLYSLKCHEYFFTDIDERTKVMRVPGGFIYTNYVYKTISSTVEIKQSEKLESSSVFIPYNDEFFEIKAKFKNNF